MADILVIGYGNELRGDDGLGLLLARSVAEENIPGVRVMISRQLVPEFAADLAQTKRVVFVDASEIDGETGYEVRPLTAGDATDWCTHHADPRALLALTRAVYGHAPEAWWLTVRGRNFEPCEKLTGSAEDNARRALVCLRRLIQPET